jgi:hypothetical protein
MKHTVAICAHLLATPNGGSLTYAKLDADTELEVAHGSTGRWITVVHGRHEAQGSAVRGARHGEGCAARVAGRGARREAQAALGCAAQGQAGWSHPEKDGRLRVSYPYLIQVYMWRAS